jgi:hypothetical protein
MKFYHFKYLAFISVACFSCFRNKDENRLIPLTIPSVEVDFTDYRLDSAIGEYIKTFHVESRNRLITLTCYRDPMRHYYYMTQSRRKIATDDIPDYFFIHDEEYIVLLYMGGNSFFSSHEIIPELEKAMRQHNISLANDSLDYNPPVWELMRNCENKLEFITPQDYIINFLPCGYKVQTDSLTRGKYSLIKP